MTDQKLNESRRWVAVNDFGDEMSKLLDTREDAEEWVENHPGLEVEIEQREGPPNPGGVPTRDNPNQCGCGVCAESRMGLGADLCIKCETKGCNPWRERGVSCE
jgi:hypothetical protein